MTGAEMIAAERERQVNEEGWTAQHDRLHTKFEISSAAMAYICHTQGDDDGVRCFWPWDEEWFKPSDPIRNLVKAGALIAAEIDRLQRMEK